MKVLNTLGEQIKRARKSRKMTQAQLAARVGRSMPRISELERDLESNRWGRDRLTLFAEICDALDLIPLLVPRARAAEVEALLDRQRALGGAHRPVPTSFDDLFVDLGDDEEDR
jgi:transcriptional regulator with XRE-family HTH domain